MRGKLLLLGLLGCSLCVQISVAAERSFDVQVSVKDKQEEFAPKYNKFIAEWEVKDVESNKVSKEIVELDKNRIDRIRREYSLDWYFNYCGDPSDNGEREDKGCEGKLDNLSDSEERALIIYDTNFLGPDAIDPRLREKVLEIISDVRDNGDKGKYGRQSDFIYSTDVMLGIILMEQTQKSLSEYKWAYAKVKYLYDNTEYRKLQGKLNDRERVFRMVESDYEKDRINKMKEEYNFEFFYKRCGDRDYGDYFEFCGGVEEDNDDLSGDAIPPCVQDLRQEKCAKEPASMPYFLDPYYLKSILCVCQPFANNLYQDFSTNELLAIIVTFFNGIYPSDDRYEIIVKNALNLSEKSEVGKRIDALKKSKEVLLGYLITYNEDRQRREIYEGLLQSLIR